MFPSSSRFLATLVFSSGIAVHANAASCTALLGLQNDLWLLQPTSVAPVRISNDGSLKTAAALHPSSKLIAYAIQTPTSEVVLVDSGGRLMDRLKLEGHAAIVALEWTSPTILRVSEHRGPSYSRHLFYSVDSANRFSAVPSSDQSGRECSLSPRKRDSVCFSGDAVALNGQDIYFLGSGVAAAVPFQTATLALGTSLSISAIPSFRIEFKAKTPTTVTLRAISQGGQWREQRVPFGRPMMLPLGDEHGTVSIEAVRTRDTNMVELNLSKVALDLLSFEGNLAWNSSGSRIAFVESQGTNRRTAVLLHRQHDQAALQGESGVDGRFTLPIDGPIRSVQYLSDAKIRFYRCKPSSRVHHTFAWQIACKYPFCSEACSPYANDIGGNIPQG